MPSEHTPRIECALERFHCLALVEGLPDVIFVTDSEGRFTFLNRAAEHLFELPRTDLIGRTLWELAPENQRETALTLLETGAGQPWDAELDIALPDGGAKHVRIRCNVSLTEDAAVSGFEGVIRDRTVQRRLERALAESRELLTESERRFRSLVEDMPDVIFQLDPMGRFKFVNHRIQEITGWEVNETLDHHILEFVVPEDTHAVESLFCEASPDVWDEELALFHRNKSRKWVRIRCRAVRNAQGTILGYEGVLRDRTARRVLEEELITSKEELLDKMKIIDDLYRHIMQSQKARVIAEHTAEVAHELKQPLAIIGGFARRMAKQLEECRKLDPDAQRECFHIIIREVQRLEKILGRLIEYGRRHAVQLEPTDPHALIEEVLHLNEERFREKNIHVALQFSPAIREVDLDADRFSQVIRNLVANAFDASPHGGMIKIVTSVFVPSDKARASGELDAKTYFEMKIVNGGVPIPEYELNRIFDPFFTTKEYGAGVGLTVTKKIVEDHKGSIGVKSDESGTVLTVWIPVEHGPARRGIAGDDHTGGAAVCERCDA